MQIGPVVSKSVRSKDLQPSELLAAPASARHEVVIGFVADADGVLKSSAKAEKMRAYLQEQLKTSVRMRRFDEEAQLYQWLTRFREVDAAWLRKDFLAQVPGREFSFLVVSADSPAPLVPVALVAHPDLDVELRNQVSAALLDMEQASSGRKLLSELERSRFSLPSDREIEEVQEIASEAVPKVGVAAPLMSNAEKRQELAWQERVNPRPAPRRSSAASAASPASGGVVVEDPLTRSFRVVDGRSAEAQARRRGSVEQPVKSVEAKISAQSGRSTPVAMPSEPRRPAAGQNQSVRTVVIEDPVTRTFRVVDEQSVEAQAQAQAQERSSAARVAGVVEQPAKAPQPNAAPQSTRPLPVAIPVPGGSSAPVVIADPVTRTYRLAGTQAAQVNAGRSLPDTVEKPSQQPAVLADPVPQAYRVAETAPKAAESQPAADAPAVLPALEVSEEVAQQKTPSQATDSLPLSPEPRDEEGLRAADRSAVQGTRSLVDLVGKTEIPVLADADGQFVKSMAANPVFEDDSERQVDETHLQESIRIGRSFNRESLAAQARTEQAQAQTGQAFSQLLPSVMVRGNRGYEISKPSVVVDEATGELIAYDKHMRTDAALTVRQPLFDLPSFLEWQRRKVKEQAREEGYRVSDGDAYISTINAYLALVSSRLQADVTRDFEAQLADLLSYIKKRSDAGAASVADMTRVRARSESTMSSRLELESAHAAAGSEFVRLTNLVPQRVRIPVAEDVGAAVLPVSFDEAVAIAMKSNPEIASLNAELDAAEIDQQAAKGRFLPRVDAEYTDTYSLHAGGAPSSDDQRDRRLMVVLNWELFSGGNDYNLRLERLARQKELQYRLDDQRRRVVQSLSANYAALATTRERIASGYQELNAIATAAEAMSKRMLSGNQSLLDLLDVYNQLYQARFRLVGLHTLEMNTMAQLARLTHGTPWPIEEVAPAVE